MKRYLLLLASLLFILSCEDPSDNYYLEEIAVRYESGSGSWINGHDQGNQINYILGAKVSIKDGY